MSEKMHELYRALPSVSEFIESVPGASLAGEFGLGAVKFEFRRMLDNCRKLIAEQKLRAVSDIPDLAEELRRRLLRMSRPQGRKAINATGILLHTGLGRAPLAQSALEAFAPMGGYSILQTSPETGKRCLREERIEAMLRELTGCEAATVVNNNAAATMLVLNSIAAGREVVISRGQLIEIGGAYRMTDVMAMSGCLLKEVGCTNRTHLRDYETAISGETGALIHVHSSNYRVRGFSGTPDIHELCDLGRRSNLPVIDDLGSGALTALSEWGLPDEPLVTDSVKAGAEVCCFSGDKLICGPQAGIIIGKKDAVERIRKNPFARMFRIDKLTIAALEATLLHFINGTFRTELPFYRMLGRDVESLKAQASEVIAAAGLTDATVEPDVSYIGSGSIPDQGVKSFVVRIASEAPEKLAAKLRTASPSVFGRVKDGALLLDMRTVFENETALLASALRFASGQ